MKWLLFTLLSGIAVAGLVESTQADAVKKETKEKAKEETVRGIIREANTNQVTLDVAGKAMAVKLTPDTRITLEGRVGKATELRPGQEVRCTHVLRDGGHVCLEMVVEPKK